MIIHQIRASGFRIIGEPIDIHFPDQGRIGILGQNESGKTTLLQVIEYTLYGLRKGASPEGERENLVTWGKSEAKLEVEFTSGQGTYNLQRVFGAKSGHRAILTPVVNGFRDKSSALTGLRDIETKIEQITGMDRDSFTKLVYIRQKDLDALKDLAKSRREQLVNKVMGIELFDDASAKVKDDVSNLKDHLEKMEIRLENVRKNKDDYDSKLKLKGELELEAVTKKLDLDKKNKELDEAKKLQAKYDWLNSHNSANDLICSLKSEMGQAEKDLDAISGLEKKVQQLKTTLSTYEPEFSELQSLNGKISEAERRLKDAERSYEDFGAKKQALIERLGLSSKDVQLLSSDLSKQKNRQLVWSAIMLIFGLALLAGGFLFNYILAVFGVIFLAVMVYVFSRYLRIDRLMTRNIEIEALSRQLQNQESTVSELRTEKEAVTFGSSFKTSEDVNARLAAISERMKLEAGESSIDGIRALLKSDESNLGSLKTSNPSRKKESLEGQIQTKQAEIAALLRNKPDGVDELQYDERQYGLVKKKCEDLQSQHVDLTKSVGETDGNIQQLERDLKILKPDHDLCPQLEKDTQACRENVELLKKVDSELCETSKELRNKVIPHARFVINQVLPTLTNGRYSDFEITEDLKFTVHSSEAGGYKEREIFSGGTQDQFLIALRLAFTQSILDSRVMADKYCLLMDECTSSSDEIRKQGIFEALDAMKQTFSQIFIIAHEDVSAFVDNNIVLHRNEHGYTQIRSKSW